VSTAATGQLVTVFTLVYAVAGPLLAASTSSISRRTLLVGAMSMFVLANLLGAAAPAYWVILVARVVAALGAAAYLAPAVSVAASVVPAEFRGRPYAMVAGGIAIATALGLPLGTLVGQLVSWRVTLVLVAGIALVAIVGLAVAFPQVPEPPQVTMLERLRIGAQPQMLVAFGANLFVAAGAFGLFVYIAPLTYSSTALRGAGLTFVFVAWGVTSLVGNIFGGRWNDRYGSHRVFLSGVAVVTVTLALFGAIPAVLPADSGLATGAFLLAVMALSIGWWALQPAQANRFMKLAPQAPHVAVSLGSSATYIGIAVGTAADGLVVSSWSVKEIGWVSSLLALLSIAFIVAGRMAPSAEPQEAVSATPTAEPSQN
jgi:predicted MFS family arabinose efflux permease